MADRSKARVCGRSLAGIAGSNPAGDMDVMCVVSTDKRQKCRTVKTKNQVRMKYRVQENTNKIPPAARMSVSCECVCCQVEVSARSRSLFKRTPTDCGVSN